MLLRHCSYAKMLYDSEKLLDEENKTVRFYKGKDELSIENLGKLEQLLGSKEYHLQRVNAEKDFLESQL